MSHTSKSQKRGSIGYLRVNLSGSIQEAIQKLEYVNIFLIKKSFNLKDLWSGRRDSNSRHLPWQGNALPLSYARILKYLGVYKDPFVTASIK